MDQNSCQTSQDAMDEDLVAWVDQEMLDTVFVFVIKGGLDHDFTEVCSSLDYGCSL